MLLRTLSLAAVLAGLITGLPGAGLDLHVSPEAAPTISFVDFPSAIEANGEPFNGLVGFRDPDGDIVRAEFAVVDAQDFEDKTIDLGDQLEGQTSGTFEFQLSTTTPQDVTLELTLVDATDRRSEPKQFSFTATGGNGDDGRLKVSPAELTFQAVVGTNPDPKTLTIANQSDGELEWTSSSPADWLVAENSGTLQGGESTDIQIVVTAGDLERGTHETLIEVSSPQAGNSPVSVPVTLTLRTDDGGAGALNVNPTQLNLQAQKGGRNPTSTVTIENTGESPLDWNAEPDADWLNVSPSRGKLTAGDSAQMQVTATIVNLNPGDHQATVTVSSPGAQNSPVSVQVSLSLGERPPQGEPTIFATISNFPEGRVVRVDLTLLGVRTVVRSLELPHDVQCGPNGQLYVAEAGKQRIVRMDPGGGSETVVADGSISPGPRDPGYAPSFFTFGPNGDLIFTSREISDQPFTGLWRLPQGAPPEGAEQILPASAFGRQVERLRNPILLQSGPFAGDLLVLISESERASDERVVRLPAPEFDQIQTFIPAGDQGMEDPAGITEGPQGDLYVSDFRNRRILRYGPDGTFKQEATGFEAGFPNQVAFDAAGTMYVTATVFGGQNTGALHIIEPGGRHRVIGGQKGILGLAICQ